MVNNQKKKIFIVIGIIVFGLAITTITLWGINKNRKLSEPHNNVVNHNIFALMLETGVNSNTYEESSSDIWPDGYTLNKEKSECLDKDGNKIADTNILKFDEANKTAIVETEETCYCYLYFDKNRGEFNGGTGKDLADSTQKGLEKNTFDGDELDYRFVGANGNVDNYICFGGPIDECKNKTDYHVFRIIGIDPDGRLKIIKFSPIGRNYWNKDTDEFAIWDYYPNAYEGEGEQEADLHAYLNKDYVENDDIFDATWRSLIDDMTWNIGDVKSVRDEAYGSFGEGVFLNESKKKTKYTAKVGLPYLSDFYLSAGVTSLYNNDNWLLETISDAWTMTSYGCDNSACLQMYAWFIENKNSIIYGDLNFYQNIYPVMYLKPSVKIKSGTGKINDPFEIEM